jgi:hypothetical protein
MKDCTRIKAAIVIFQGVDDLDVFGPFEVLANAARGGADLEVRLLSTEPGRRPAGPYCRMPSGDTIRRAQSWPRYAPVRGSGGVTAGIDLALWLVQREWGQTLADRIAREIEYERRGPVHQSS